MNRKSILACGSKEALGFFLKRTSYFTSDLPPYINFQPLLARTNRSVRGKPLLSFCNEDPKEVNRVNHTLFSSKDGEFSWRQLQLIHPILYVNLIQLITKDDNWDKIKNKFDEFQKNENIKCLSIPVKSMSQKSDKAELVLEWWQEVELASIELALEYEFLYETDIANCYPSIYTHSIAWALEGKDIAKVNQRDKSLLGNCIDTAIQQMQNGQTNGIPQGSILMDFIAEMVLGYADIELTAKLENYNTICPIDYKILRYRDDYRIFVNSSEHGKVILKELSDVLAELGLMLNSNKTILNTDVISASIKKDKRAWIRSRNSHENLLKYAILIKEFGVRFPNSGSLVIALDEYNKTIDIIKNDQTKYYVKETYKAIISIIVDIAIKNPKTYPVCSSILSKLFCDLEEDINLNIIAKIHKKLLKIPNVGYFEIWLQRATIKYVGQFNYNNEICKLVQNKTGSIWNVDWISEKKIKDIFLKTPIIDDKKLENISEIIESKEIDLFYQQLISL